MRRYCSIESICTMTGWPVEPTAPGYSRSSTGASPPVNINVPSNSQAKCCCPVCPRIRAPKFKARAPLSHGHVVLQLEIVLGIVSLTGLRAAVVERPRAPNFRAPVLLAVV